MSEELKGDNDKIKFENKGNFNIMIISPNKIKEIDWMKEDYLDILLEGEYIDIINSNPENFITDVGTNLNITNYKYPDVKTVLFYEEPNYHYELMYVNMLPEYKKEEIDNEFSLLLQNYGDEKIYGNVILLKTYVPINNITKNVFSNISKEDIKRILYDRVHTKVITYDNGDYEEKRVFGPMDNYAESFFDEEDKYNIQKIELAFLSHNINIWFTKFDYGEEGICGDLLKHIRINKCIVFTLIDDNYRGNLSMDEFKKIKLLSNKLDNNFLTPEEISKDEKDSLGRDIIKNKYRILELMYNKYI